MAHRIVTDKSGVEWEIWDVHPTLADRRQASDRRAEPRETPERRVIPDRRVSPSRRGARHPALRIREQKGWLAFGCKSERRRLMRIPERWSELPDEELLVLLEEACANVRTRRGTT